MNREQTKDIIGAMIIAFPNYKPNNLAGTIQMWSKMLEGYTYEDTLLALETYIKGNTSGFAPSIGQIINLIHEKSEIGAEMTEMDAWQFIRKAISNGNYHAQEEFDKLPQIIQKVVGSANMIKQWAQTDMEELETVIQSNFMRSYRAEVERQKKIARMPIEIRNQIEQKKQKMLEVKDV